jgi:hypothetical protein
MAPVAQESVVQTDATVVIVADTEADSLAAPQAVAKVLPSNQSTRLVQEKLTCPQQLEESCLQEGDQVQLLANTSLLSEVYVIRVQVRF